MGASAAKAKKPAVKPKTAQKTPVTPTKPHVVKGTTQWTGENAGLNETFTLDKTINFTLKSLEYSAGPFNLGEEENGATLTSGPKRKFLILHFTLHNPTPEEKTVNWATVHFTVVDQNDANNEGTEYIGVEKDKSKLDIRLKPGQKVECFSSVLLPSDSIVAKIIVKGNEPENGVLRYFKEKLKISPIKAPYADPKDPTGATSLGNIPAQIGTFYNLRVMAYRVDSLAYSPKVLDDRDPDENMRYFVATVTIKNISVVTSDCGWGESGGTMLITDQDEQISNWEYLLPKAGRTADYIKLKPDQERTVRFGFLLSKDSNAKTLILCNNEDSLTMTLDVSNVK